MATTLATPKKTMPKPPPGDPWQAHVDVILDPATQTFKFETNDLPMGPDNKLFFANDGQPGFVVTFHLKDPTYGFVFPENLDEALYSVEEAKCPDEPGQWSQFHAKAVNNNGHDLVVRNHNKKKQDFGYTLLVIDDSNNCWKLDPIGGNENGPAN
jgi:hypothetical protein